MKRLTLLLFIFVGCSHQKEVDPVLASFLSKEDEYRQCFVESDSYKGTKVVETRQLIVEFEIDSQGKAIDRKISQTDFKDANFHACILSVIRTIHFPPAKSGETIFVKQPIKMKPVD